MDLQGYKPFLHADSNTNAGGVGVFVAQNLEATVLGEIDFKLNCEDIWLRIFDKNSNNAVILGAIHGHPSGDDNDFITVLNQKIASFGPKQKCYILGDLNINVDPNKSTESATDYMHMLSSNNCYMLIDKLTRVGNNTNTVIDHVITNDTSKIIYPTIFINDITDHFPVGCFVGSQKISTENVKTKKQTFFLRNMRRFNKDKFLAEMVEPLNYFVDLNVTSSKELNEIFTDFVALVHSCKSKHAPLVLASRKKRKLLQKPWITKGILVSIRHKQKLYTSHYLHGSELQKRFNKTYANKLTKIKRL